MGSVAHGPSGRTGACYVGTMDTTVAALAIKASCEASIVASVAGEVEMAREHLGVALGVLKTLAEHAKEAPSTQGLLADLFGSLAWTRAATVAMNAAFIGKEP